MAFVNFIFRIQDQKYDNFEFELYSTASRRDPQGDAVLINLFHTMTEKLNYKFDDVANAIAYDMCCDEIDVVDSVAANTASMKDSGNRFMKVEDEAACRSALEYLKPAQNRSHRDVMTNDLFISSVKKMNRKTIQSTLRKLGLLEDKMDGAATKDLRKLLSNAVQR